MPHLSGKQDDLAVEAEAGEVPEDERPSLRVHSNVGTEVLDELLEGSKNSQLIADGCSTIPKDVGQAQLVANRALKAFNL